MKIIDRIVVTTGARSATLILGVLKERDGRG